MITTSLAATATPAFAHGTQATKASNYKTSLYEPPPELAKFKPRVVENGGRLEIRNNSSIDVVVQGYDKEPYLKINSSGTYVNKRSSATYLNQTRSGSATNTPIPSDVDSTAEPVWEKTSSSTIARWHDHRAHWMLETQPEEVKANPNSEVDILNPFVIPITVGNQTFELEGSLKWVPAKSVWAWYLGAIAAAGLVFVVGRKAVGLAFALLLLVGLDLIHAVGLARVQAGTRLEMLGRFFNINWLAVLIWVVGIVAATSLLSRNSQPKVLRGASLAIFVGPAIFLLGGLADVSSLKLSQLDAGTPGWLARVAVVAALGAGPAIAIAGYLVLARAKGTTTQIDPT